MQTIKDYSNRDKPRDVTLDFRAVRRKLVRAAIAPEALAVASPRGLQQAQPGDYIVQGEDGDIAVHAPESFRGLFVFASEQAPEGFGTAKPAPAVSTDEPGIAVAKLAGQPATVKRGKK